MRTVKLGKEISRVVRLHVGADSDHTNKPPTAKTIKICCGERVDITHGAGGEIKSNTEVSIPNDCFGIMSVTRDYGSRKILLTSQFLPGGWTGCPVIHLYNGGNDIELTVGDELVNLAIVKAGGVCLK